MSGHLLIPPAVAVALALLPAGPVSAQSVDENLWVTNGTVNAVACDGATIYLAGSFTRVGPATGGAVPIDSASGLPLGLPKVAGSVYAVAPDGAGGWYVGGLFTHVGGAPRSNIAHIRADHSVSAWDPNANSWVNALVVSGGTVYAAGFFTGIGGQFRNRIAALDAATGLATAWNPNANSTVYTLSLGGSTVYAGGDFINIGGQSRNRIAALDTGTGLAAAWNPNANNTVLALAVSGSTVYAGGYFTTIGGQTRNRIAALNASTGLATTWNPNAGGNVAVLAVSGSTVYAGGFFTTIGGQTRNRIAALDATTGLAAGWNPDANNPVRALIVTGSTVYAGGNFTGIGGQARNYLAALDVNTGLATAWDPNANSTVIALAKSGSAICAGGAFVSIGGQARSNLAGLDASTGLATAWNPNADGPVHALSLQGSTVYAGGDFTNIGGQVRNHLAALDAGAGVATTWNPNANDIVYALAVTGSAVYAGGSFSQIGGKARNQIAALDTAGMATAFDPNPSSAIMVRALAVSGGTVYAGGDFTDMGGQVRNYIAALDATTGLATPWNPDASNSVYALAVSGSTVYAGGNFLSIGGQARSYIAALDAGTGMATAWNPGGTERVRAVAVGAGAVYVGGSFTNIGGQARNYLAALDASTGLATDWDPNARQEVNALALSQNTVYAGGAFASIGGLPHSRIAGIARQPEIAGISADRGGNHGAVTVVISGAAMRSGASASLVRLGHTDLWGSTVIVTPEGTSLTTTFDLEGAAVGAWDAVVVNPDGQKFTLPNGFTIEASAPFQIRVNVIGPTLMRPNRRRGFDLVLENLGNTDVHDLPLWVSRIPESATVELDFALASPPRSGGEPDWGTAPLTLDGPGGKYLALLIPRLPPGINVRRIYLTVPGAVPSFTLDAALTPPWADDAALRSCLGPVIGAPACMGAQLTAINAYLAATPSIEALSGIGLWAKIAWQCEGAASLPAALQKAEQILDYMLQPVEGTSVPTGCEVALGPRWQDRRPVRIVTSVDPNEKIGAGGVGASREIGSEQILPYSIHFENADTASAAAQEVMVIDALDGSVMDLNTMSLSAVKFGKRANGFPWTVEPPPGLSNFTTDVDLRPEQPLIARVSVSLDRGTGIMAWSLSSIDPLTGRTPENPLLGLLPPNVAPPEGEGSVLFTVMPKAGLAGGTAIRNRATIDFDGVSLLTAEWSNLLDATAPESQVELPGGVTTDSVSFTVRWEASEPTPDLRDYSVYVSEDGGAYRPWRVHTTATADTITAPGGRTYAFYSLARDSSGNLEAVPPVPDAETFSRVALGERPQLQLALTGAVPNPSTGGARVWFTLPSTERAVLEVIDIAGRRLLQREVGELGPGRHVVDVSAATRRPGIYFLRLLQGAESRRARAVVIQ